MKNSIFRLALLAYITFFCIACAVTEKLSGNEFLIEGEVSDLRRDKITAGHHWRPVHP